ncbi:MAG: hypothetical protein LBH55_01135, partial [Mycoplasmataceae bacterium]|nr:hypothetical protein [Mycoplasmataceae bacterium]
MKSKFFEEIKISQIERQVEDVYNKGITMYFPNINIEYPFGCDGVVNTNVDGKLLKLIIEYKFDETFKNPVSRAKVLVQVIYYIKKFEQKGEILPNVCLVGDKNECFVFHVNDILSYLDEEVDWTIAPSHAHLNNPALISKIVSESKVNPFIFDIDDNFSFKEVSDKIKELALNIQRYVHITEHNLSTIFDYFAKNVIKNADKLDSKDIVSYFIGIINNDEVYYKHPTKKNILVAKDKHISIDDSAFVSFFKHFQKTYTPQEKNKFTEIADRLISDLERRRSGDFWTPTPFVDYAHKMLSEQFGDDWKEKYVVYDNCCGSCNLTRDYKFKELYCSTLFQSELDLTTRYNPEATKFQFDWLND